MLSGVQPRRGGMAFRVVVVVVVAVGIGWRGWTSLVSPPDEKKRVWTSAQRRRPDRCRAGGFSGRLSDAILYSPFLLLLLLFLLYFLYIYIYIYISLYVYSAYSRSRKTFFLSDCLCNNQIIWFLPTWNIFVYTRPFSFLKKGIIITWLGHWNSDNKISAFFLPTFTCPRKEKKKVLSRIMTYFYYYTYIFADFYSFIWFSFWWGAAANLARSLRP